MLYDRRDFGLLRLAGTYQWLPLAPLRALSSLKHLYREAELLSTLGLLSFSRSNQYLMPSPEGYQFLASSQVVGLHGDNGLMGRSQRIDGQQIHTVTTVN